MTSPRYVYPKIPVAPVPIASIDTLIQQVMDTSLANVPGLIFMLIKGVILSVLFGVRAKLINQEVRRTKQEYEQSSGQDGQNEADQPIPG